MKWYKHDTKTHTDEKIRDIFHRFGAEGYAVYIVALEIIAEKIDKNFVPKISISDRVFREKLRVSHQKLTKILSFFDQNSLIFSNFDGEYWNLNCPNLLKRLDNWTRNLQVTSKKLSAQQEEEEEQEEEKELNNGVAHFFLEPNPKQVSLKSVRVGVNGKELSEGAKHKIHNKLIHLFKIRGWEPSLIKSVMEVCANRLKEHPPEGQIYPYYEKIIAKYINENSEAIASQNKKMRNENKNQSTRR